MPIDPTKYGKVAVENQRNLGDDEYVFILAGHDALAVPTLKAYLELCRIARAPQTHLDNIRRGIEHMQAWQAVNDVRIPTSQGVDHV
jgi:hypothetical protein